MAQSDSLLLWLSVCDNVQLAQHLQGRKNADSRQLALNLLEEATVYTLNHPDEAWKAFESYKPKELNNELNCRFWDK